MSLRQSFIAEVQAGEFSFSECCRRYGISRKSGYKWHRRFNERGRDGLFDRPRIARTLPHATSVEVETLVLWARMLRPTWGPKKLKTLLEGTGPALPALSTMSEILSRHGASEPRRRIRRESPPYELPLHTPQRPNDVWCMDFKGDFQLGNGTRCYPLTLTDAHTRFLLECEAMPATLGERVQDALERAFREYGLPLLIRSDNGIPFVGTNSLAGLSQLSVWLMDLGVWPERTRMGSPQDNGRHERMHRTLKAEACHPPSKTMRGQQRKFDAFRQDYNHERPHEALGLVPPGEKYEPSPRAFPRKVPKPEYPPSAYVRRVAAGGWIKWNSRVVFVSKALASKDIGLTTLDGERWTIRYGQVPIGVLDSTAPHVRDLPVETPQALHSFSSPPNPPKAAATTTTTRR
jgi:transposase InsO family protein